jgi:hypothetical protein
MGSNCHSRQKQNLCKPYANLCRKFRIRAHFIETFNWKDIAIIFKHQLFSVNSSELMYVWTHSTHSSILLTYKLWMVSNGSQRQSLLSFRVHHKCINVLIILLSTVFTHLVNNFLMTQLTIYHINWQLVMHYW